MGPKLGTPVQHTGRCSGENISAAFGWSRSVPVLLHGNHKLAICSGFLPHPPEPSTAPDPPELGANESRT